MLKAAVEGKLTAEWRAINPTEPASKLLERILAERRQKWEADQLSKFAAAGKEPPKNWKAKYVEPKAPDTSGLPELPERWCWETIGQLCKVQGGIAFSSSDYCPNGIPLVRISNIIDGRVNLERDTAFLPSHYQTEYESALLRDGDVLMALSGATTGKIGVFAESRTALLNQRVGRFLYHAPSALDSSYTRLIAHRVQAEVVRVAYGAAQPNVSPSQIEAMPIPLMPYAEQQVASDQVAEKVSQIQAAELTVEHALCRAARLRQSILKQAFEGRLVPQDPSDEPANTLLERIRSDAGKMEYGRRPPNNRPGASRSRKGRISS